MTDQAQDTPQGYGSLPDGNTSEAIIYGPAYSWIKSALWVWDEMEDYLLNRAEQLEGMVRDRAWSCDVLRRNPYLIFARSPPVNEVDRLKDLFTLRQLCKVTAGLRKLDEYRRQNLAWARMKGIEQYVKGMAGRGISESEWKAATADFNDNPITYDSVHYPQSRDPGDGFDWNEALRDLMGPKEYDRMVEDIFGKDETEEDGTQSDGTGDDASAVDADDFDDLGEALAVMFDDSVGDVQGLLEASCDECSAAADYWEESDVDGRAIIDMLISFAEAMRCRWRSSSPSTRRP